MTKKVMGQMRNQGRKPRCLYCGKHREHICWNETWGSWIYARPMPKCGLYFLGSLSTNDRWEELQCRDRGCRFLDFTLHPQVNPTYELETRRCIEEALLWEEINDQVHSLG